MSCFIPPSSRLLHMFETIYNDLPSANSSVSFPIRSSNNRHSKVSISVSISHNFYQFLHRLLWGLDPVTTLEDRHGAPGNSWRYNSHQQPLTAERVELVLDHTRGSSLKCQTTKKLEPQCIGLVNWCKPQLLTFRLSLLHMPKNVFTIACCPMSHIFWIQLNLKRSKTCQKNVMNVMNVMNVKYT